MTPLFITGASGFIGQSLLEELKRRPTRPVVCLSRDAGALRRSIAPAEGWRFVEGDLLEPGDWCGQVPEGAAILHLAAATGAASAEDHRRINVGGTDALLRCAAARSARRLVLVSSIAVGFRRDRYYHYALAKREAERLVRDSGLPNVVVRPTMVFGPGSPVLKGLQALAGAPVGVLFGRGDVVVQPIHVQDLVTLLLELVDAPAVDGAVVEAGGPERLTLLELMRRIRMRQRGRSGPWLRLPAAPIREMLAVAGVLTGGRLPMTAGQIASFVNDGIADDSEQWRPGERELRGVDASLG